jgi:Cu(I)/Ag(I) efflux system membrane fusion protein
MINLVTSTIGLLLIIVLLSIRCAAAENQDHAAHSAEASGKTPNTMTISNERLQSIGVKFEEATRREVNKTIRTVGRVETDERRLARVNIKLEGWIDQLYVNTTGQKVKKGQLLFTLYSPDLVATQEEYLLAVRAAKTLGTSDFPEVAEGARNILEVSRRRLQLWDIADYHIKDLERTGKVLKTLPFHAPLNGTVIEKTALAGMRVMPGEVLYTIADLSKIWVIADIYEYELPLIQTGQTAQVSLSYASQTVFTGRIAFIYPTVDPETRTAKVRFELDNPKELLKPGMYANVELAVPLGTRLAVSKDAVLESGERQIIFIHHGGGRLEWRNVKIGLRGGDWVEIVDGLQEGEHIVTSANFLLDSESQLKAAVGGMSGMKH